MARCDQGYLCVVCGKEVEELIESELYLRYALGEVDPELLHKLPERHLRCNPTLAQFIVDPQFPPVDVEGMFAKSQLDSGFVAAEESRVTSGYHRLRELTKLEVPIHEYPLVEPPGGGDRAEEPVGA